MPKLRVSGFFRQLTGLSLPEPGATVAVEELSGSAPYFWAAAILERLDGRTLFFITESNEQAEQSLVYFQSAARVLSLELLEDSALVYPDYECSSLFDYTPLTETQTEQIQRTQQALLAGRARIVFLPYRALFRRTLGRELIKAARLQLKQAGEGADGLFPQAADAIDPAELARLLAEFGYEHSNTVVAKGQFSRRGGIVDVFPFTSYYPVRLDFFGDEIESVKSFDPATQRSVQPVGGVSILPADPAKRILAQPYALDVIEGHLERFYRETGRALSESARQSLEEAVEHDLGCIREGRSFPRQGFYVELAGARNETIMHFADPPPALAFLEDALIENETRSYRRFWESRFSDWRENGLAFTYFSDYYAFPEEPLPGWLENPGRLAEDFGFKLEETPRALLYGFQSPGEAAPRKHISAGLETLSTSAYTTTGIAEAIRSSSRPHLVVSQFARRISELLNEANVKAPVHPGLLPRGFAIPGSSGAAVVTDLEIFGELTEVSRAPARTYQRGFVESETDLKPGDYVVHIDYGIGRFSALKDLEVKGITRTYVELGYAGGDKLFVPADQLDRLKPYRAAGVAKLSNLGRETWHKTKERVRQDVLRYAKKLFKLYRQRRLHAGFAFTRNEWMAEFEEGFPYELTRDQSEAWEGVRRDMESPKVMDRLVCGEVGFGKTEIALRAAFKACLSGKQTLMLCPTTILADQHYKTFSRRFKPFPFRVELLSRFKTPAEQKQVLRDLAAGRVDVVIATHRALGKDVEPAQLGLLIVDEEQRFGVKQKETLKMRFPHLDVLTLTATPIPRTLRLSLLGLMDVSLLGIPPPQRKAVKTYVGEYNENLVRDAILKELGRGGQVYFLHNRVQDLHLVERRLKEIVPEASIGVAHGKLPERRLEEMMDAFSMGVFKVLLATTIIENGLDIPTVNTLIVDRAELLGLAQMHQLRGRVGRSHVKAFAYLFHSPQAVLTDEARERLRAIYNYAYLGAGYEIAQQDLLIRGAGTILGTDQSGAIELVGMDYYFELLCEAVEKIKELPEDFVDTGEIAWERERQAVQVDLPLACFIPEDYIADTALRMRIYRRIADCKDADEMAALRDEMRDRFGKLPQSVENLFYVQEIKLACRDAGIHQISYIPAQRKMSLVFATPDVRPWLQELIMLDSRVRIVQGNAARPAQTARGPGRYSVSDAAFSSTASLPPGEHIEVRIPFDAQFAVQVQDLLERVVRLAGEAEASEED